MEPNALCSPRYHTRFSRSRLQVLSIASQAISVMHFTQAGSALAVGCAALGQLLVWDWRTESHVLKQQGHLHMPAACAYSPDGGLLASGGDDSKVKVWGLSTANCIVTFSEHTHPVTAVLFLPSGHALLSASLDGTVRAWDLVRYRPFRTFTTPEAA